MNALRIMGIACVTAFIVKGTGFASLPQAGDKRVAVVQEASKRQETETQKLNEEGKKTKVIFQILTIGDGIAGDGKTKMAVKAYQSGDGTRVTMVHGRFASTDAADAEFQRTIKQALKVIDRNPRKKVGFVIGQRAIVLLPAADIFPERTAILLTEGNDYYQIVSTSRRLALEFEKQYF